MMKRIIIGSDHAGLGLKTELAAYLKSKSFDVVDVGTHDKTSCHYPDFAEKLAEVIRPEDKGVLVCGSGIGISIAAVKCRLRCSVAFNEYTAKECRLQNCQVIAMGDRVITPEIGKIMVGIFLEGY